MAADISISTDLARFSNIATDIAISTHMITDIADLTDIYGKRYGNRYGCICRYSYRY